MELVASQRNELRIAPGQWRFSKYVCFLIGYETI